MKQFYLHRNYLACIALLIFVAGCTVSRSPITDQRRLYAFSWQQERQIGEEADGQIQQQFGVYPDEALSDYVVRVGEAVLAESHMRQPDTREEFRETPFTFRVLDSPVVNAFALPGGYIYVTRGLLTHLNNEAQLAMILGHEIVHVAARHASQRQLAAQIGQIGLIGGAIIGQEVLGLPAGDILEIGGTAAQLLLLRYGRDDERESDSHGVAYAAQAGYRAEEGAQFFVSLQRMSEEAGGGLPNFLSTHPDPGEREATILQLAEEWEQEVEMTILGEDEYYNAIAGMVMGEDPRQGFVDDDHFFHPELDFQFPVPADWLVSNQPTQVQMIDREQRAAIVLQVLPDAQSAGAAAEEIARQQGISVVERTTANIHGNPAAVMVADATQNGQVFRIQIYLIEHGGNVYRFVGYTAQNQFDQYRPFFDQTMTGFQDLQDPARRDTQPTRIQIVTADRSAPFSEFLPSGLPRDMAEQDLAIINQVELDETIQQGRRLKLPSN